MVPQCIGVHLDLGCLLAQHLLDHVRDLHLRPSLVLDQEREQRTQVFIVVVLDRAVEQPLVVLDAAVARRVHLVRVVWQPDPSGTVRFVACTRRVAGSPTVLKTTDQRLARS